MTPVVDVGTGKMDRLKDIIDEEIVAFCQTETSKKSRYSHLLLRDRPRLPVKITGRRSALLFGPPGTSEDDFCSVCCRAAQLAVPRSYTIAFFA